jgi:hypothetical protein
MALTQEQADYFDSQLGPGTYDASDLEARLARMDQDPTVVVRGVLEGRMAKLLASPASFAVPGEYSQSTGQNITALQLQLNNLGTGEAGGIGVGRMVRPDTRRRAWRWGHSVTEV